MTIVVSGAMAAGTAMVGAFRRGSALHRKGGYRIELGQPNDFFREEHDGGAG
jgi:hypothetical protein